MSPSQSFPSRRGFLSLLTFAHIGSAEAANFSDSVQEKFLHEARILKSRGTTVGITGSLRATLTDDSLTHDAHIQMIDEAKLQYQTIRGTELNFRDTWKFNIAAYRLDRLLDLGMVPVSVQRNCQGKAASFTWWVDDVAMMEVDRHKKKIQPPDQHRWNCQIYLVRIFDQLICNTDRNLQNLLITKNWDVWMIDHTRAFRLHQKLLEPKSIAMCDRKLLENLKQLNSGSLSERLYPYVGKPEIDGILARRDHIVQIIETRVKAKGEASVLYDRS